MKSVRCRTIASPVGTLTIAGHGNVVTNLRMEDQTHPPPDQHTWVHDPGMFPDVVEQLHAYFAGSLTRFDVTIHLRGSDFQERVWHALAGIPFGETRTYGELARQLGRPGAARAVGLANGRNPIAIIVPCHRVIGSDGSLTGYGGGMHRKRALLELEDRVRRAG